MPRALLPLSLAAALAACAAPAAPQKAVATGYLGKPAAEALAASVAPPPAPGSPADLADAEAVRAARVPLGSPRALAAEADAELDPASALALFDCALGARLQAAQPPALTRLFTRELVDASDAWTAAKLRFPFRPKPNLALSLKPCTELSRNQPQVSAYPAGHAVTAALWSRTLAALAPDRAAALSERARQIGWSRVVCALQYPTDLEAGRLLGDQLYEAEQKSPDFQADLQAARAEVAAARALKESNPGCLAQSQAESG